jgi:hypothetical protein
MKNQSINLHDRALAFALALVIIILALAGK